MSLTFSKNHQHIIFSTKERQKIIVKQVQTELWAYIAGTCKKLEMNALAIGGTDDHVHVLLDLPPRISVAQAMLAIKSNSSRWMKERVNGFSWQEGYGAFSVSASNVAAVEKYVFNQEQHHRKKTFQEEYLAFLKRHGVEFDPRYVFA
jgi:REP element-mobilizing transposase RayT